MDIGRSKITFTLVDDELRSLHSNKEDRVDRDEWRYLIKDRPIY